MSFREIWQGIPKREREENRQWEAEIKKLDEEATRLERLHELNALSAREKWRQKVSAYESYKRSAGLK